MQPRLVARDRVRDFMRATRVQYLALSLLAALVFWLFSRTPTMFLYRLIAPPTLLVCRRGPHSPVFLHCLAPQLSTAVAMRPPH
jgi:hypothetical protein